VELFQVSVKEKGHPPPLPFRQCFHSLYNFVLCCWNKATVLVGLVKVLPAAGRANTNRKRLTVVKKRQSINSDNCPCDPDSNSTTCNKTPRRVTNPEILAKRKFPERKKSHVSDFRVTMSLNDRKKKKKPRVIKLKQEAPSNRGDLELRFAKAHGLCRVYVIMCASSCFQ
jgi:hypothetical protein